MWRSESLSSSVDQPAQPKMNAVMKSSVSAKAVKVSRTQVRPQASLKQFAQASGMDKLGVCTALAWDVAISSCFSS